MKQRKISMILVFTMLCTLFSPICLAEGEDIHPMYSRVDGAAIHVWATEIQSHSNASYQLPHLSVALVPSASGDPSMAYAGYPDVLSLGAHLGITEKGNNLGYGFSYDYLAYDAISRYMDTLKQWGFWQLGTQDITQRTYFNGIRELTITRDILTNSTFVGFIGDTQPCSYN